jgi:hypothetical protein
VTRAETAWIAVANWRRRAAYCRDDQERKVLQHLMQSWAFIAQSYEFLDGHKPPESSSPPQSN